MKAYTDCMPDTMTDDEWREAIDAEIAADDAAAYMQSQREECADALATLSPRERFGLMLGAMVGEDDMANMLDAVDYENDILDRQFWAEGC